MNFDDAQNDDRRIILDVFGTVAQITRKKRPFNALLRAAFPGDSDSQRVLGARFLTQPISLIQAFGLCAIDVADPLRVALAQALDEEIGSIELFEDAVFFIHAAQSRGHSVALCSNLAEPYQRPVQSLLEAEGLSDIPFFSSFAIGSAKPDPRIYQFALDALGVRAQDCLFIGDTIRADRDGPREHGMAALLLDRESSGVDAQSVSSFRELAIQWGWADKPARAPSTMKS